MQCKEEMSNAVKMYIQYIERVTQFLTPQGASSGSLKSGFAGVWAGAVQVA